jgi:LacI family transcriptional regulator
MTDSILRVALIVETSLAYGRGILCGVSKYMATHEPWFIYVDERSLDDPPPNWLRKWGCDGVIMRAQTHRIAQMVADLGVPAVDTLHQLAGVEAPVVTSDPIAIAQLVSDHLWERHFEHFAFVGVEGALWSDARRDAFVRILANAGYECDVYCPQARARGPANWERDQKSLMNWLCALPKPVGVLAPIDLRARQVLDACRSSRLIVPDQVAVVGAGNDEVLCNLAEPPLTSVKLNFELLGYEAASLLDQLMKGKRQPDKPTTIKPLGVATRRSTDIVAIDDALTAQALRYIQDQACNGIKVAEVVAHCGASRRVLELNFEKFVGISPHEYIVRRKIARVKQLLLETDYSLDTIATKCGFPHAPYLSVLFKKNTGQTPGEFRRSAADRGRAAKTPSKKRA